MRGFEFVGIRVYDLDTDEAPMEWVFGGRPPFGEGCAGGMMGWIFIFVVSIDISDSIFISSHPISSHLV